jgi:DNA-directed RNA polymerase specialized sigma24 family protein
MDADGQADFTVFFTTAEPKLRMALCGGFGSELGREAAAEALAWGWQHWSRLRDMANPIGYLYRVGQSSARREIRHRSTEPGAEEPVWDAVDFEPGLGQFLAELSEHQRVAVWMVHGLGYPHRDVADVLGCAPPTVATHVRRALEKLRADLEVINDV